MRLIDADYLREFLKINICGFDDENKQLLIAGTDNKWHDLLGQIPTAYDIDKVVEEIEKKSNDDSCAGCCTIWEQDAIRIIKQGGVADDVCEWYADNKGNYKCKAHAEIYDSRVLDWNVCPYCGKKIKVVE